MTVLKLSLAALLLGAFTGSADAQVGLVIDDCGTIVEGVECDLWQADSGGLFILFTAVPLNVGDRAHVVGTVDPTCISFCQQGNGCILATSVTFDCDGATGEDFCNGDGGDQAGCTDCPCGNNASVGTIGGCLNSANQSARIERTGLPNPDLDTLRFEMTGGNPNTFGVLVSGQNLLPTNPMNPCAPGSGIQSVFADGLRCVGGGFLRHGSRATDSNGDVGKTNAGWGGDDAPPEGLIAAAGFAIGETRYWQVFYREDETLVCQTGQNTTQTVPTLISPFIPIPGSF